MVVLVLLLLLGTAAAQSLMHVMQRLAVYVEHVILGAADQHLSMFGGDQGGSSPLSPLQDVLRQLSARQGRPKSTELSDFAGDDFDEDDGFAEGNSLLGRRHEVSESGWDV